jgi:hypothetical protein
LSLGLDVSVLLRGQHATARASSATPETLPSASPGGVIAMPNNSPESSEGSTTNTAAVGSSRAAAAAITVVADFARNTPQAVQLDRAGWTNHLVPIAAPGRAVAATLIIMS